MSSAAWHLLAEGSQADKMWLVLGKSWLFQITFLFFGVSRSICLSGNKLHWWACSSPGSSAPRCPVLLSCSRAFLGLPFAFSLAKRWRKPGGYWCPSVLAHPLQFHSSLFARGAGREVVEITSFVGVYASFCGPVILREVNLLAHLTHVNAKCKILRSRLFVISFENYSVFVLISSMALNALI